MTIWKRPTVVAGAAALAGLAGGATVVGVVTATSDQPSSPPLATQVVEANQLSAAADAPFVWNVGCLAAEGWGIKNPGALEREHPEGPATQREVEENLIPPQGWTSDFLDGAPNAPASLGKCIEFKPSTALCDTWRATSVQPVLAPAEAVAQRLGCTPASATGAR